MKNCICLSLVLICFTGSSQSKLRKFSNIINHPSINTFAPYISADGRSLAYVSDNTGNNTLALFYTKKGDAVNWEEPAIVPKSIVNTRLSFLRGFSLNTDGTTLYFTSLLQGLGGFDIYSSTLQGSAWSSPVNIGMPINSARQEGSPCISIDGKFLYFMRCESMDKEEAKGCTLLVSRKNTIGNWEEPVPLPDYINTGNSQTPRILGDGETLLFSSDRFPQSKGKMDLYTTRFDGKQWSDPIPLTFANTEENDQYVSSSAFGRYLLKAQPGRHTNEIVEMLFPPSLKPKSCMIVRGKVAGITDHSSAYVNVFDWERNLSVYKGAVDADGTFEVYLKQGNRYGVSIEPGKSTYTFYSKAYDLRKSNIPAFSRINPRIEPIAANSNIRLEGIVFEPHTAQIAQGSAQELRRLARMIKANPDYVFRIGISLEGYRQDSVHSDPDLTEKVMDTLHFSVTRQVPVAQKTDSASVPGSYDSAQVENEGNKFLAFTTVTIDSAVVKTAYHNDRTPRQAQAIVNFLIKKGVSASSLEPYHEILSLQEAESQEKNISIWVKALSK